jgi:hypothetical protein
VTAQLLALPELKAAVERALANATDGDGLSSEES